MIAAIWMAGGLAHAEAAWTVQVDPLTAALGFAHVQVERVMTPRVSVYAGPHLRLYDGVLADVNGPYRGAGLEAGVRLYPWGEAPTGPWVLVRGVGAWVWTTDDSHAANPGGYGSALVGYTGIVADWLVLSGGLGAQRFAYTVGPYGPTGWGPAAHSTVGVAF